MLRFLSLLSILLALLAPASAEDRAGLEAEFRTFLASTVLPKAEAAGVSRATFDAATAGLALDWSLPDLLPPGSRRQTPSGAFQAEFTGPERYLAETKLAALAAKGRSLAGRWQAELAAIERRTGVPAGILLAIWGKESSFGAVTGDKSAIRTLATQAFLGARRELFLGELIAALRILEEDHIALSAMRSSWAGAMGQPQFLPSKFLENAADGDGDGRRDIWRSAPDSLASIGLFLANHGWQAGLPWGVEVEVPDGVSCTLEGPDQGYPVDFWARSGVRRMDGTPISSADIGRIGHLLMPAGRNGPAFLVSINFYVLKSYNESDLYAVLIGHVGDRIARGGRIAAGWKPLGSFTRGEVRGMQQRLEGMGHDVGGADGLVGFRTRVAVGRWQEANGRPATCFPDSGVLSALR